ncbi:MAG: endonuclease/exonuclease/phosphatase family protein [Planctomycetes bacterium]|nr:endonuclease/exonuclease/phosphatase family protein [Planctomycetota bacterium]
MTGLLLGAALACAADPPAGAPEDGALRIRAMTFNLRYANPGDGPNRWEARRDFAARAIREHAPHFVGLQEALPSQLADLRERLPEYGAYGVDRNGDGTGEHSSILFDSRRLRRLDGGTFWLSETPETPGSKSWDSSLPRIATWCVFAERSSGRCFVALNTHLDHRGQGARRRGASLIRTRIAGIRPDLPRIVTGDFNALPGSEPQKALLEGGTFRDAWVIAEERGGPDFTFHGFTGKGSAGHRIDWILVGSGIDVERVATIDEKLAGGGEEGRDLYLSDHFPVAADLLIRETGGAR